MNDAVIICDASTGYMPGVVVPAFASKREEVRWKVRHLNLCALDRAARQVAAADPGIEWDPAIRQYRIRPRGKVATARGTPNQSDPSAIVPASPPASPPAGLASA